MENNSSHNQDNGGGAFVLGAVLTGLVAVGHNLAKDDQHRQELYQVYQQGYFDCNEINKQALSAKEMESAYLRALMKVKDTELAKKCAEIDRLNGVIENQAKALMWQQIEKIFPPKDDTDNT